MQFIGDRLGQYEFPVYSAPDIENFVPLEGDAIYKFLDTDGLVLYAFVHNVPASRDLLSVIFPGARNPRVTWPYFQRITSSLQSDDPFIAFTDPTMSLDSTLKLCWFAGTARNNPDRAMEKIVRIVMASVSAHLVSFEGSSGGGFAAMRIATRFQQSIAIAFSPQTDALRYLGGKEARKMMAAAMPDTSLLSAADYHWGRFRLADLYRTKNGNRGNLVNYVQNTGDYMHIYDHLNPFLLEIGLDTSATAGLDNRLIIDRLYYGKSHVAPPLPLWQSKVEDGKQRLIGHFSHPRVVEGPADWVDPPRERLALDEDRTRSFHMRTYDQEAPVDFCFDLALLRPERRLCEFMIADYERFPLHALLNPSIETSGKLTVVFDGAKRTDGVSNPFFGELADSPARYSDVLHFSDPNLYIENSVLNFGSTSGHNPSKRAANLVRCLADRFSYMGINIVGLGEGALAAIYAGLYLQNSGSYSTEVTVVGSVAPPGVVKTHVFESTVAETLRFTEAVAPDYMSDIRLPVFEISCAVAGIIPEWVNRRLSIHRVALDANQWKCRYSQFLSEDLDIEFAGRAED